MDTMTGAILLLWTCRERPCIVSIFITFSTLQARGMHQHTEVVAGWDRRNVSLAVAACPPRAGPWENDRAKVQCSYKGTKSLWVLHYNKGNFPFEECSKSLSSIVHIKRIMTGYKLREKKFYFQILSCPYVSH